MPQHLPHVTFKTSDYLCYLRFTPKVNRNMEKVSNRRRLGDNTATLTSPKANSSVSVRREFSYVGRLVSGQMKLHAF